MNRISKDAYLMNLARTAATRGTCPRRAVGAVLVRDGRVIATGYNGSPPGHMHCFGDGCMNNRQHCINTIHAELNALLDAPRQGDTLYCTDTPCNMCFKAALSHNPQIKIKWWREYADTDRDQFVFLHKIADQLEWIGEQTVQEMLKRIPVMEGERLA